MTDSDAGQDDGAGAEELYRRALAAHPGHGAALGNLAGLLADRGEPGRAEVRPWAARRGGGGVRPAQREAAAAGRGGGG